MVRPTALRRPAPHRRLPGLLCRPRPLGVRPAHLPARRPDGHRSVRVDEDATRHAGRRPRRGLLRTPRQVTHAELAERLGISQQAVSDRLHRAHANLVEHALTVEGPENSAR
ncbi:helix-turn-helix domain-containing protein [Halobacteriaceae archaeon GCM10025711]